ncbi:hypothetical protein [Halosolutus gelatinilyticus]|uniref:hypothetical protein n=1 Tax=Halosolutus gelatinilyticus TaxID=2931975 RepID=UPI002AAFCD53|nr:hypothetical protein [Halosolutus gelatinilyticus]
MTVARRSVLATGAVVGLGSLAGCLEWPADGLASTPARVGDGALMETGYDDRTGEEFVVERSIPNRSIARSRSSTGTPSTTDRRRWVRDSCAFDRRSSRS